MPDRFLSSVRYEGSLSFINRQTKTIDYTLINPSGFETFHCLRMAPDFDMKTFPFVFYRDRANLGVINVASKKAYILKQSLYCWDPYPQHLMEVYKDS
jgi:hypothetical protein